MTVKIHRELNGRMSQNLADDLHGHIVLNRPRCKSMTNGVKGVMRRVCVFEDPVIHIAQIAWFDRTAELVGENISVIAVTLPQTTLFEKLPCLVDKKLL